MSVTDFFSLNTSSQTKHLFRINSTRRLAEYDPWSLNNSKLVTGREEVGQRAEVSCGSSGFCLRSQCISSSARKPKSCGGSTCLIPSEPNCLRRKTFAQKRNKPYFSSTLQLFGTFVFHLCNPKYNFVFNFYLFFHCS